MTEEEIIAKWTNKKDGYIKWCEMSCYEELSEEFIGKYWSKVDWVNIAVSQNLSIEFIKKWKGYLPTRALVCNKYLSLDYRLQIMNELGYISKEDSNSYIEYSKSSNKVEILESIL